jgi:hypothetical protein
LPTGALPLTDRQVAMSTNVEPKGIAAGQTGMSADIDEAAPEIDMAERRKVYRWFVRGTLLFAAHVLAVLLVLGYVFSDGFG